MRWSAARALGGRAEAVPALAAALGGGTGRARARSDHDRAHARRRRGKRHGAAALSSLAGCRPARGGHRGAAGSAGRDPAVHGGAAGGQRFRRAPPRDRAWRATCRPRTPRTSCAACSRTEQHPNVCAAAIDVLAEVGTRDAIPALQSCADTLCRHAVSALCRRRPPSLGFRTRKARSGMAASRVSRRRVPSTLRRKTFGASANFSIAAPACRSTTASAITSIAVWPSGLRRPARLSFQAYFAMLRSDADHEIEHLINAFTVNETYFYREEHQLRCMTSDLLDDLIRRKTAGGADPHLVDSLLDRRGALFDRDLADGELERSRSATISRSSAPTSTRARSRPQPRVSTANAPSCGSRGT